MQNKGKYTSNEEIRASKDNISKGVSKLKIIGSAQKEDNTLK